MGFDLAREVVLKRAAAGLAVWVAGLLLTVLGFDLGAEGQEALTVLVLTALSVAVTAVTAWVTRQGVTPLVDPRNDAGVPLTPDVPETFPGSNYVGLD